MKKLNVECAVPGIDNNYNPTGKDLYVRSHEKDSSLVTVCIPETSIQITVDGGLLEQAIRNAMNTFGWRRANVRYRAEPENDDF